MFFSESASKIRKKRGSTIESHVFFDNNLLLSAKTFHTKIEKEENEVVFFLLSFSDLSHHRTCGSAYGGSYFGCHSRYDPIKVAYPALHKCSFVIALCSM